MREKTFIYMARVGSTHYTVETTTTKE